VENQTFGVRPKIDSPTGNETAALRRVSFSRNRSFFPNQFVFHTFAMGTPGRLLCSLNMDPVEAPPPHQIRCDGCSQTTPSYDIVHYGSWNRDTDSSVADASTRKWPS
jgi:hypothetical protein